MTSKSKRNRSPSYPAFGLETAVEKVISFYAKEGFNETLVDVALQNWGYTSGSSNGYRAVSALIQYGLLEDEGSGDDRLVFLTERGKTIAVDEREVSQDRIEALKEAALSPTIFKKLWEKYGSNLPSDASLKYFLVRELEFNQKHVDKFIKIYKNSLDYASLSNESKTNQKENGSKSIVEQEIAHSEFGKANNEKDSDGVKSKTNTSMGENGEKLTIPIPLINGKQASLSIPIPLSDADFNLIKNLLGSYLDNMKPAIVKNEEEK